jgi:hypothetical protein
MSAAQTNRSAMTMRIRAELESIADRNGIFAISVPKLARRLNMSDIPVSMAFYDLIKTGELCLSSGRRASGLGTDATAGTGDSLCQLVDCPMLLIEFLGKFQTELFGGPNGNM